MQVSITIICCFLNEEKFLPEAVRSVVEQEGASWELILVDDGSTDGSTAIARGFSAADPGRVIYTEHPGHENRGLSASRNLGISLARGRMVCFLDADDVYLPGRLCDHLDILARDPAVDMVMEATEYWYNWEGPGKENRVVPIGIAAGRVYQAPNLSLALYPLGSGEAPCTSSFTVRTDAIRQLGGFEDHFTGKLQLYEDQGFLAKAYLRLRIHVSSACHSRYRQHPASLMRTIHNEGGYHHARKYFLLWVNGYLQTQPEIPGAVRLAVTKALRHYRRNYFLNFVNRIKSRIHGAGKA